jgi:hypothetical protein
METRLKNLEKTVEMQSYLLWILMTLLVLDTAAIILLWNQNGPPDFDHIAVSLTVFQTLFGLAALYGFWALRGLTREKAEEVAEAEIKKIAQPMVQRIVMESLRNLPRDTISDDDLAKIVQAVGDSGKEV